MKKTLLVTGAVLALAMLGFLLGRLTAPVTVGDKAADVTAEATLAEPITDFPPPIKVPEKTLVLEQPVDEASASGPFQISGRARDGASLLAELRDSDGQLLWTGTATLAGAESQSFSLTAEPTETLAPGAYVLTVVREAADGTKETVTRDLAVGVSDAVKIKVYFQEMSTDGTDCTEVKEVERLVSANEAVYRAALLELLKGPTAEEKAEGFATSLPSGVTLKSVAADAQGTVTADFSRTLDRNVAGSCRIIAIRSQIEKTLLQFPEARGVIISVEGQVEEALQP